MSVTWFASTDITNNKGLVCQGRLVVGIMKCTLVTHLNVGVTMRHTSSNGLHESSNTQEYLKRRIQSLLSSKLGKVMVILRCTETFEGSLCMYSSPFSTQLFSRCISQWKRKGETTGITIMTRHAYRPIQYVDASSQKKFQHFSFPYPLFFFFSIFAKCPTGVKWDRGCEFAMLLQFLCCA